MGFDFNDARQLDFTAYDLCLADGTRGYHRAMINRLANGSPPYTDEEAAASKVKINVNDLSLTRLCHDARSQFSNGFLSQARYLTGSTDTGPLHKRAEYNQIFNRHANRALKQSIQYFEVMRSKIGSLTLHGIAPAVWETEDKCIPRAIGVEDVLVPSDTLLGFENLPFFFLRRSFTGIELAKMVRGPHIDPGWNLPFVERCLKWLDEQMTQLVSDSSWPVDWSPEKWEELRKQDGGFYGGDRCPTIDCFDIYGYQEASGKQEAGWVRRIILDSWSNPGLDPVAKKFTISKKGDIKDIDITSKEDFLFTSGNRKVASSWQNVISFQFADLSSVAPFRYHSVRSLGWMLYAVCHLRNRMYCKTQEAVFEALLQYFKVKSVDDMQRALKVEMANFGVFDETLLPLPANERWQPNAGFIELGLQMNEQLTEQNSRSWTASPMQQKKERETNFQRMADIQAVNALVSAGMNQAYQYQVFEYRECVRRMMLVNSQCPVARRLRNDCLRDGIPEEVLVIEAWDIQSERMMGGGNQTFEMMIAQQLMEWRSMFDPESQRDILRIATGAVTKDPALAESLVPETPNKVTPATDQAGNDVAKLAAGVPVQIQTGTNHIEYIEQMLKLLGIKVKKGMAQGGMVDQKELQIMAGMVKAVQDNIKILAQDETQKERVLKYNNILKELTNQIKAFAQRLQQAQKAAQQKAQQGNGQPDPKAMAKVQEMKLTGAAKREEQSKKAAQKRAEDQVAFEQRLTHEAAEHHANISKMDLETAANIRRGMFEQDNDESDESRGSND